MSLIFNRNIIKQFKPKNTHLYINMNAEMRVKIFNLLNAKITNWRIHI